MFVAIVSVVGCFDLSWCVAAAWYLRFRSRLLAWFMLVCVVCLRFGCVVWVNMLRAVGCY